MTVPSNRPVEFLQRIVQVLAVALTLAMVVGIVWAAVASSLQDGLAYLMKNRWGVVTLIDIYAGAFVVSTLIWICERRFITWLLWTLGLLCLGHLVSLVYLIFRLRGRQRLADVFLPNV